ncbi:MAG: hypothetical protein HKO13_08290 [Sphingomonas sp.]|nr:hypothetical protein [Sphingomonas sp.]RZV52274.1 MAG: hypothetical protein EX258_02400 [Sphingomonadaceae bacterium]
MIRAIFSIALLATPGAAIAQDAAPTEVQRVVACRTITDDAERLACFDREAAALDAAIETDEVVVVSKEQAEAAQRELFGFSTPNFAGLLGDEDKLNEVEFTISRAQFNAYEKLLVESEDGSVWLQIDDRSVGSKPKAGTKVTVSKGTLGSYDLKIEGRRSFKARRLR